MTNSKIIGAVVVIVAILTVVAVSHFMNSSAAPGIALRQPESPAATRVGSAPQLKQPPSPTDIKPQIPGSSPSPGSEPDAVMPETPDPKKADPEIVVHVAGAVKHPGVYHLHNGARNDDAVRAAGGLAANANEASLNLAAPATDGAQLYVKNTTEQPSGGASDDSPVAPPGPGIKAGKSTLTSRGGTPKSAARLQASSGKPSKLKDPSEGKININTASAEDLQRVSGIGPAMAAKIIAYRQESHGFQSLDDLLQISGVGSKKLSKWSPFFRLH